MICRLIALVAVTIAGLFAESLTIVEPWARATVPAAQVGAVYATLTNAGVAPIVLVSAISDVCDTVELHTHVALEDGSVSMRKVDQLLIPGRASVTLKPGKEHIMLIGLHEPLVQGEFVVVTLTDAAGMTYVCNAKIGPIAAFGACCQ